MSTKRARVEILPGQVWGAEDGSDMPEPRTVFGIDEYGGVQYVLADHDDTFMPRLCSRENFISWARAYRRSLFPKAVLRTTLGTTELRDLRRRMRGGGISGAVGGIKEALDELNGSIRDEIADRLEADGHDEEVVAFVRSMQNLGHRSAW